MARIKTIAREDLGEFTETFDKLEAAMGFIPNSLLTMGHEVTIDPDIADRARASIQAMLDIV